ncbi:transcriptional regulator, ArsR family [Methanosalsum zhilinae DSM 4017]|uniref:Transcriptional regulator, ArsR family n=1 Tax=Methanosalsum zhilinae (strain DSM 4017 / NBRC 107636 / OCM 62 / WeN5) TaxID=679901 RepID=F7XNE1_METZD|nr:V4R domain-containing protein [Methanosalsum zhilinae]AEH61191.1 transcriptional regulator, ArsR family [Methanosalsum zhilinae DSM 4017]
MSHSPDYTALFSTVDGFIALNGAVKLQILEFLKDGPKTFEELVKYTGKAKSTVSVHLKDLNSCNLVEEKPDSNDRRKKIYVLKSHCMAHSQEPMIKHYQCVLHNFSKDLICENDFFISIFHALRFGFEAYGINHRPISRKIGSDIGRHIALNFKSSNFYDLLEEIALFWKENGLGNLSMVDGDPVQLIISDCFGCRTMPRVNRKLCFFEEGIFEGIFFESLNKKLKVREIECCGTGHDHCLFLVCPDFTL